MYVEHAVDSVASRTPQRNQRNDRARKRELPDEARSQNLTKRKAKRQRPKLCQWLAANHARHAAQQF